MALRAVTNKRQGIVFEIILCISLESIQMYNSFPYDEEVCYSEWTHQKLLSRPILTFCMLISPLRLAKSYDINLP